MKHTNSLIENVDKPNIRELNIQELNVLLIKVAVGKGYYEPPFLFKNY